MILDYVAKTGAYILRVRRGERDPQVLMKEYGLDFSTRASTPNEAILFTHEPFAAVTFFEYATPAARDQLRAINTEIDRSWADRSARHIDVPDGKELWPFQKAAVEYALSRSNTLLGDQPGLGKTEIAIAYCNETQAKRVLVICPASIRLQWVQRIQEWSTMPWPFIVHGVFKASRGINPDANWTVISYDLIRTAALGKALTATEYDVLILDEAHYVKTIDSRRTRAIFGGGTSRDFDPIGDKCRAILALTGTPLPNRPREAYTLARGLCFDAIDWLSEDDFNARFNPREQIVVNDPKTNFRRVFWDERSGRHAELQNRLRANFMTRHLKRDVMTQLQMPVYDIVQADIDGPDNLPVRQALAAEQLLDIDPEMLTGRDGLIDGEIATVRRMMGIALAPQVARYVQMLLDGGEEKIVVFAWHTEVLDILQKRLDKAGVVRVDGSTSGTGKAFAVNQFRINPCVQVIIGNMLSLGVGTDGLQHVSNHAIIAEPDWVPGNNVQAFDRLDRGGQQRQVLGEIFVAPGSFAERVLASALRKLQTIHNTLDRRIA